MRRSIASAWSSWGKHFVGAGLILTPLVVVLAPPQTLAAQGTFHCDYYQHASCCNCNYSETGLLCAEGAIIGFLYCDRLENACGGECVGG